MASVEGEELQLQREHEEPDRHAMSLSVEPLEIEEDTKPEIETEQQTEQQRQHDEHEQGARKGVDPERVEAEAETRATELGDIVEDVHAVDAEHENGHVQPSIIVSEPQPGPEIRDTPAAEADADSDVADSNDSNAHEEAHEEGSRRRAQHSIDASVSSTWTAVDDVYVAHAEPEADAKGAPNVLFKLQEDEGVQTENEIESAQKNEDAVNNVSSKDLVVPSVVIEEVKPYVLDDEVLQPHETPPAMVEASPPAVPSSSQDQGLDTLDVVSPYVLDGVALRPDETPPTIVEEPTSSPAAPSPSQDQSLKAPDVVPQPQPSEPVLQSKGKCPSPSSLPRTVSSTTCELDDHAPELHTPGHIPSIASLFLPSPEVRVFVTECAKISWWIGIAAAPTALLYLFHNRKSLLGRT